jgi:hypothetical protein
MVFRVNFVTFWVLANSAFAILTENYLSLPDQHAKKAINDGSIGFLEVFALYLASLVVYRVFFGMIHILKFKTLTNCVRKYRTPKYNLHDEVRRLRQETVDWNESLLDENDADMTILGNQNQMLKTEEK